MSHSYSYNYLFIKRMKSFVGRVEIGGVLSGDVHIVFTYMNVLCVRV